MPGTKAPARLGSISQNISHVGYKRKCPHNLARCEDEENYFIKYYQYYPNKSEWVLFQQAK